jgi:hypothetical protein
MRKFAITAAMIITMTGSLAAGPFARWRGNYAPANTNQGGVAQRAAGGFANAASAAAYMASIGRIGHFGGNPYAAEGVGMGPTADSAIRNCCFYGRRSIADQGVCQGSNGMWYACNRYN